MSTVTTSGTLVPGTAVTMRAPNVAAGAQLAGVLLQNLSGYQLAVSVGSDSFVLPPYVADVYRLTAVSAAFVSFLPTDPQTSPAGLPAYVNATWLAADELPDPASYPAMIPAPAFAVGLAVAQQLLNQGIPSTLIYRQLFSGNIAALSFVDIDVSQYATAAIQTNAANSTATMLDPSGNFVDEMQLLPGPSSNFTELRVTAPTMRVANNDGAPKAFAISGTNRPPANRYTSGYGKETVANYIFNGTLVNGASQTLPTIGTLCSLQGVCYAYFRLSPATVTGYFQVTSVDGNDMLLIETADPEFHTSPRGGIAANKMIALPPWGDTTPLGINFHTSTGGAAGAVAELRIVQCDQ